PGTSLYPSTTLFRSEIMRLFIAREAVDPHLQRAGGMVDPKAELGDKVKGAASLGAHFAGWVPGLVAGWGRWPRFADYGALADHLDRKSTRLNSSHVK